MLRIDIVNNRKGPDSAASYDYTVSVNGRTICLGFVSGHNRKDPWWDLLAKIVEHEKRTEYPEPTK